eukprot:TRINITY_DN3016_c0_g1_i5.p1 TRINITY_DN3016_c0_g1~~TRINITY_DN3016_c0_g1_i5.p1  ORF type:complete len:543 (+),score=139.59 TRINITY_DN3016_c0_g1_i5:581-2209(+)
MPSVVYNFKTIPPILEASPLIDAVLTKTQRKTPTVIHEGKPISAIRKFYMRKVAFTSQTFVEKMDSILENFPRINDIHPFFGDLMATLYNRDHYKLALGQIQTAKNLITQISKIHVRLLKFGDSLYRCKTLKRAAIGRMCTLVKRLKATFSYLEEVRKHLQRLPSINPSTRTVLMTGFPNVGKSSFMNLVTRANVDVQAYEFTTKSLYVGHMDHKFLRWQVIDTPGILDHPLEERNVVEMQAVTALVHLQASVLFFIDISEQCGYSINQQASLFHSIKVAFTGKPLIVVATKCDVTRLDDLEGEKKDLVNGMIEATNAPIMQLSNFSKEGVDEVKNKACEMLLASRVSSKVKNKSMGDLINRITVAKPTSRDDKIRGNAIPDSVIVARQAKGGDDMEILPRQTLRDLEVEAEMNNEYFSFDLKQHRMLENDDWKNDIIPEIMDGKNIADFIDPEVNSKLAALEEEEEQLAAQWLEEHPDNEEEEDNTDVQAMNAIRDQITIIRERRKISKGMSLGKKAEAKKRKREEGIDIKESVQVVGNGK